jgi:hypothetical protein
MRFSIRIQNRELPLSRIETICQRTANADSDKWRLAAEVAEEPEKQGQADTEKKAGDDRKVKGGVFATMRDVSGEAPEAEGELGAEVENGADEDEESAKEEERAAEFAKGIHSRILPQATDKPFSRLRPAACYHTIHTLDR